jgi:hypothetical protein
MTAEPSMSELSLYVRGAVRVMVNGLLELQSVLTVDTLRHIQRGALMGLYSTNSISSGSQTFVQWNSGVQTASSGGHISLQSAGTTTGEGNLLYNPPLGQGSFQSLGSIQQAWSNQGTQQMDPGLSSITYQVTAGLMSLQGLLSGIAQLNSTNRQP